MKRLDLLRYFLPIRKKLDGVEDELQRLLSSDVAVVEKLASHIRGGKGKRLRPALVLLSSRFMQVESDLDVRFGAIFELIHTATLVHDDVIDHASTRRGKPTLNKVWGNTLTVLFGDLLYIHAMGSAIEGRDWRLMEILAEVTTRMIEGELIQNDVLFRIDTTRKDYFDIQERKTALLFAGCTETGAVLAGRSKEDCAAMHAYGLEIGRAFQLTDDLLDFTATSEQLGKPAFSDLREGKLTLPMLTLMERAPEAKSVVQRVWDRGEAAAGAEGHFAGGEALRARPMEGSREAAAILPEDETLLRDLLHRHHALEETQDLAKRASAAATAAIQSLEGEPNAKKLLLDIPAVLLVRGT